MRPLKVLVYEGLVSAMKAQGSEPKVKEGMLIKTSVTCSEGEWFESGVVIFDTGLINCEPLSRIEVLPGQFPTEEVISIDVPGALDMDLKE